MGYKEIKDFVDLTVVRDTISKFTAIDKKVLTTEEFAYLDKFTEGVEDALQGKESFF